MYFLVWVETACVGRKPVLAELLGRMLQDGYLGPDRKNRYNQPVKFMQNSNAFHKSSCREEMNGALWLSLKPMMDVSISNKVIQAMYISVVSTG